MVVYEMIKCPDRYEARKTYCEMCGGFDDYMFHHSGGGSCYGVDNTTNYDCNNVPHGGEYFCTSDGCWGQRLP